MKPGWLIVGLSSMFFLLLSSCEKENDLPYYEAPQGEGILLRVLLFSDIDSETPICITEEYEYDDERISRVSSPMYEDGAVIGTLWYDLYEYNSSGQLATIKNFNSNKKAPSGFLNLKNYTYTYSSDGKKKKEYIEYPQISSFEYYLYSYDQNRLIRIEHFGSNDELESYVEREYDEKGYLVKESTYAYDNQLLSYTKHEYTGGLNTRSDEYAGSKNEHMRQILKTYDEDFNLIVLESNELSLASSMMSYVLRYEYMNE